tara:strand:+ start:46 stop:546 length:501 start_codon:yes stop_codon:yes gene_type:complete
MNKLWAPWRMDYIHTKKDDGCIFCEKSLSSNDQENLILYRGVEVFALMNLYPYSNGHIMIAPYLHTADTNQLNSVGNQEIMWLANKSMNILKKLMNTDGFNFGANLGKAGGAGIEEHLHYHIVPRWSGDNNFMPVINNTRVIVEALNDSWSKLKPQFDLLGVQKDA